MLNDILSAHGWKEAFWLGLGGFGASFLCALGQYIWGWPAGRNGASNDGPGANEPETLNSQLEAIEGIGPSIARHLRERRINSFAQVAAMSPRQLCDILDEEELRRFSLAEPMSWPLQAHLLATGRFEQFLGLAIALRAGVPSLKDIFGIGIERANRLKAGDVRTLQDLRIAAPDLVANLAGVPLDEATRWIADADRLYNGDRSLLAALANIDPDAEIPTTDTQSRDKISTDDTAAAATSPMTASDGSEMARFPQFPPTCGACCGMIISALFLSGIVVAWFIGYIPIRIPSPPIQCEVCPSPETVQIHKEILVDNLFTTNNDQLTGPGRETLDKLAQEILAKTQKTDDLPGALVIIGHADRRRSSVAGGNQGLSERRAESVAHYLKSRLAKWPDDIVFALGKGSSQPHASTAARCGPRPALSSLETCLKFDRRVDVNAFYLDRSKSVPRAAPPPAAAPQM